MDGQFANLLDELEQSWGWKPDGCHFDFGDDHEFFKACLKALSHDYGFNRLEQAMKISNYVALTIETHTLKGVCVNLGLESLADDLEILKEKLGSGDYEGLDFQVSRIIQWQDKLKKLVEKMDL